jgi:hypothetical protein
MISAVPPAMALTLLVTAMAISTMETNSPAQAVFLADSMVRHHQALLESPPPGVTGVMPDPDLAPFKPLTDWESRYAVDLEGKTWLLTYATSMAGETSALSATDLSAVPLTLASQGYRSAIYGLWSQDGRLAGYIQNTAFNLSGTTDIPENVPIMASIVVPPSP